MATSETLIDAASHWSHGAQMRRRGWDEERLFLPHQQPLVDSTSLIFLGYEPEWKGQRW